MTRFYRLLAASERATFDPVHAARLDVEWWRAHREAQDGRPRRQLAGNQDGLLGFRVPALLVSPLARRNHVSRRTYEHTSILRMIESRWSLEPLTVRDATANDLSRELRPVGRRHAPRFDVPRGPFGGACPVTPAEPAVAAAAASTAGVGDRRSDREAWAGLREVARDAGWPV
jgi:phospholipase C